MRSWLVLTFQQFEIPMSRLDMSLWNMDGVAMVNMSEADFKDRVPCRHGENLYAQFDIWRTNYNYCSYPAPAPPRSPDSQYNPPPPYPDTGYWCPEPALSATTTAGSGGDTFGDIAYMLQMLDNNPPPPLQPAPYKQEPAPGPGQSPPPYPHPATPATPLMAPASAGSSDYGMETMEEEDGESQLDINVVLYSQPLRYLRIARLQIAKSRTFSAARLAGERWQSVCIMMMIMT